MFFFPVWAEKELIKGFFQNLRQDELDKFIKHLQTKMMVWGAICVANNKSGGSAVKAQVGGRGVLSFVAVQIGPFLD